MKRFVCRENIKHYRELLRDMQSETERQRITALLDEELGTLTEHGGEQDTDPVQPAHDQTSLRRR
jgi:hypothetical protein